MTDKRKTRWWRVRAAGIILHPSSLILCLGLASISAVAQPSAREVRAAACGRGHLGGPKCRSPRRATMKETYPAFVAVSRVGLLAPEKTPPEIIARLHAETARALGGTDLKARFADLGLESVGATPGELDRWIRAEIE